MSIWDKTSKLPQNLNREEKRFVVATDAGFEMKRTYVDKHGAVRQKSQLLNTISGLANTSNFGSPNITDVWHDVSTIVKNNKIVTYVSFDEPVKVAGSFRINVANTAGGNAMVATSNTLTYNANNTLGFAWTPTVAGTYKIQAQTVANTSGSSAITSLNAGHEAVSRVISGVVSNTGNIIIVTAS